ncbi:MAG: hypothetical protein EBU46_00370 [Nitrosomonadaceae bacterium]|nr:hypothetical protein [Nitrosomonadaceae bacterium]
MLTPSYITGFLKAANEAGVYDLALVKVALLTLPADIKLPTITKPTITKPNVKLPSRKIKAPKNLRNPQIDVTKDKGIVNPTIVTPTLTKPTLKSPSIKAPAEIVAPNVNKPKLNLQSNVDATNSSLIPKV